MQRLAVRLRPPHLISTSRPRSIPQPTRISIPRTQHRRIAFRHAPNQPHGATYQPVRFQEPSIFSRKRQLTFALYCLVSIAFFKWINSHVTIEVEVADTPTKDKKPTALSEEEDDEEDEEEEYTFIPMTWAKKLPREFYRGSDPEWLEFVKIAKDKPRHRKIQDTLIQQVYTNALKHPGVKHYLGTDMKVGKYWLDISFPDGPPQEFERSGLEIGETQINWATERISPEEQFRLQRALWPSAVFGATWAASKAVGGVQFRRMKQWLGIEEIDPFSPEERLRLALEVAEKQQNAQNQKGRRGSGPVDPVGAELSRSSPTDVPASSDETKKRFPWQLQLPMPSLDSSPGQQSMNFPLAQIVFTTSLNKNWSPKKMEPPRGTFVVQGMMEIRGSKGQILFDVRGCYDPKQGKYVMLQASKRGQKLWNQRPRGGP